MLWRSGAGWTVTLGVVLEALRGDDGQHPAAGHEVVVEDVQHGGEPGPGAQVVVLGVGVLLDLGRLLVVGVGVVRLLVVLERLPVGDLSGLAPSTFQTPPFFTSLRSRSLRLTRNTSSAPRPEVERRGDDRLLAVADHRDLGAVAHRPRAPVADADPHRELRACPSTSARSCDRSRRRHRRPAGPGPWRPEPAPTPGRAAEAGPAGRRRRRTWSHAGGSSCVRRRGPRACRPPRRPRRRRPRSRRRVRRPWPL